MHTALRRGYLLVKITIVETKRLDCTFGKAESAYNLAGINESHQLDLADDPAPIQVVSALFQQYYIGTSALHQANPSAASDFTAAYLDSSSSRCKEGYLNCIAGG